MNVKIISSANLDGLSGHQVVVLDIFRASNTIMALLHNGASRVYLLGEIHQAFALKKQLPSALLCGERKGETIEGMEAGNSPTQAGHLPLSGRKVILTTSAGTQAVGRLCVMKEVAGIVFGSFANASHLVDYLLRRQQPVALLPMGLEAREPALEDDLAASFLQKMLLQQNPDFDNILPWLLSCEGSKRLLRLKQEQDLGFCTTLDRMPVIATVQREKDLPPFAVLA